MVTRDSEISAAIVPAAFKPEAHHPSTKLGLSGGDIRTWFLCLLAAGMLLTGHAQAQTPFQQDMQNMRAFGWILNQSFFQSLKEETSGYLDTKRSHSERLTVLYEVYIGVVACHRNTMDGVQFINDDELNTAREAVRQKEKYFPELESQRNTLFAAIHSNIETALRTKWDFAKAQQVCRILYANLTLPNLGYGKPIEKDF